MHGENLKLITVLYGGV